MKATNTHFAGQGMSVLAEYYMMNKNRKLLLFMGHKINGDFIPVARALASD